MASGSEPMRVLVTGAAGKIGYLLCGMIASGQIFGNKQPIILHMLDIPEMSGKLEGTLMELYDCAYPLLKQVIPTCDPVVAFQEISVAILLGGRPRQPGEARSDLIASNVRIFKDQGRCLDTYAHKDCKVLVVTNPCHTLATVCSEFAPSIPKENFSALSRLDHNCALATLASKLEVPTTAVKNVIVWGNHSPTMFADASHAVVTIGGQTKKVSDALGEDAYLRHQFVDVVASRGSAVIAVRKVSSALSAAKAAADHMHDWFMGTPPGTFVTMGVMSDGSYGAPKDMIFSFPVEIQKGKWSIVKSIKMDDFTKNKIDLTSKELIMEKADAIAELGKD